MIQSSPTFHNHIKSTLMHNKRQKITHCHKQKKLSIKDFGFDLRIDKKMTERRKIKGSIRVYLHFTGEQERRWSRVDITIVQLLFLPYLTMRLLHNLIISIHEFVYKIQNYQAINVVINLHLIFTNAALQQLDAAKIHMGNIWLSDETYFFVMFHQ